MDQFVAGKEVENLVDIMAKDVNTAKLADGGGVVWVWIRPLGREAGSGVEAAVCELRICMVILWTARRLEWSYS